jgi:hypothetical protein
MQKRASLFVVLALACYLIWQWQASIGQATVVESLSMPEIPTRSPEQEKELSAFLDKKREEMLAHSREVTVSGEPTAGTVIALGEKTVQLPKDVYVAHEIIGGMCATTPCPKFPLTILAYVGQPDKSIAINRDGTIYDLSTKTAEQNSAARNDFTWLVAILEEGKK